MANQVKEESKKWYTSKTFGIIAVQVGLSANAWLMGMMDWRAFLGSVILGTIYGLNRVWKTDTAIERKFK